MPIQLPLQHPGVNLPGPPADPPTLADVISAKRYADTVKTAAATFLPHAPTQEDAARAEVYKTEVIIAHLEEDAAPPWFMPALRQGLRQGLAPMHRVVAQSHNLQCDDGSVHQFQVVPFNDGTLPTEDPHNLPPLINLAAVRGLSAASAAQYAAGYGLGVIEPVAERRRAIGRAIGCVVPVEITAAEIGVSISTTW